MVRDNALSVAKCKDQVLIEMGVGSLNIDILHAKNHQNIHDVKWNLHQPRHVSNKIVNIINIEIECQFRLIRCTRNLYLN